jgi:uncharacterized membrane protein
MVLTHVTDSWTSPAAKQSEPYFALIFIGGLASTSFLFLAGVATAMSAAAKARREGSLQSGAALARRRGWEIFALGLVFRVQAQVLGFAPLMNVFKVDMLNTMGLAIVAASYLWQLSPDRRVRLPMLALATTSITMLTPLVRSVGWLSPLPDPIEAYIRPAGPYAAFPLFPWAGFVFGGALVGELVDATRTAARRAIGLQIAVAVVAVTGAWLAWTASFQPALFANASFWHDSPTFFFIRLGIVALGLPVAWVVERLLPPGWLQPLVTLGRSSLFVYWIHVEMVYGVIAEPLKGTLPLWASVVATAAMSLLLYGLVLLKNRWLERYDLRGPFRMLAPVLR